MIYLEREIIVFALNVYREAARECRRKKKEYIKCLENRVAVLENRNQTLIDELKSLKELYQQKTDWDWCLKPATIVYQNYYSVEKSVYVLFVYIILDVAIGVSDGDVHAFL